MNSITEIFKAIAAMFGFATKVIPSDKIRNDNHELKKPRLSAEERTKIYDREFHRLKHHPEIDIATDVNFINDALDEEDRKELIQLLTDRLNRFRNHKLKL